MENIQPLLVKYLTEIMAFFLEFPIESGGFLVLMIIIILIICELNSQGAPNWDDDSL
jgi:hypothetical protein